VLSAALQAGFRESGAINLTSSTKEHASPMVAVRSMGLALESLIGFHHGGKELCSVSEQDLRTLLEISNERFRINTERITRFQTLLKQMTTAAPATKRGKDGEEWEDAEARKERKRAEGLRRKQLLKDTGVPPPDPGDISGLEFLE
jgi:tRNA wybutosine-synthesizing protein 3